MQFRLMLMLTMVTMIPGYVGAVANRDLDNKFIRVVNDGDLKSVETLIAAGADVNAIDDDGKTPLMIAARKGDALIASKLINEGADVNVDVSQYEHSSWTALNEALRGHPLHEGHDKIVNLLIANGAAKNQKNFGELFRSVVFRGRNEMVKAFLVEAASIDLKDLVGSYEYAKITCSAAVANAIEKEILKKANG